MPINTEDIDNDQDIFSKHFWGESIQEGIKVLLDRLSLGETTTKNIIKFMDQFEKLEEEYANGLKALSTIRLYKDEYPSVKRALNEMVEQVLSMSKAHAKLCSEIKILASKKLKECLSRESNVRKEQKELTLNQIQSTLKAYKKASKNREIYFNDCKIKEILLSQKPHPMAKSFDIYEEKLQKIMNTSQEDENAYIETIKHARIEHDAWVETMSTACIECQQIEQDRIETISNAIKNLAVGIYNSRMTDISCSQAMQVMVCDSEDGDSIIKYKQDFISFCESQGTGRSIPEPPQYINYYTMSPMALPALAISTSRDFSRSEPSPGSILRPPPFPESHDTIDSSDSTEKLFSVQVLYDYKARQSEELDLTKGQVLIVTSLREDPWWIGYEENNPEKIGVFPSNYVSKIAQGE